jgi:hypothetical protein
LATPTILEVVMNASFGPQLLGETEKALNALLLRSLAGSGLDERQWVTLRVASQHDGPVGTLAARVADRAQFKATDQLVEHLERLGLIEDERPTAKGEELLRDVLGGNSMIWQDVPEAEAAARALSTVLERARAAIAAGR